MAQTLLLDLSTPTGPLVEGAAVAGVEIPGLLGEIGVLPDHEPYAGPVAPGVLRFVTDGAARRIAVGTGFFEVAEGGVVRVLVDRAKDAAEVDPDEVRRRLADLSQSTASGDSLKAREVAYLQAQLRAAGASERNA